jgi:hypothetical protein
MPTDNQGWAVPSEAPQDFDPNQAKQNVQPLTFGQKLVGLTFNPSGDEKVNRAKQLCADLADLIHDEMQTRETSEHSKILEPFTYGEILNAQMNVVKLLTLKY